MKHFYSFVSQVRYCWCPPFSVGYVAFLFICLPVVSLLVSAFSAGNAAFLFICLPGLSLLCPPFSVGHASVSQVCHCWCPPFSAGNATFLFICFPGLSLVVSTLFRWPCSISIHLVPGSVTVLPPFSAGHVAFLFICLPCDFCLFVFQVWCLHCCFLPRDCLRECIPATLCMCNSLSFFSFSGKRSMNDRIGFCDSLRACVRHQKSISCHILRSSCFYFSAPC